LTGKGNPVDIHRDGLYYGLTVEENPANNVKYVGRARNHDASLSDACWQIVKYTYDGTIVRQSYANWGKYNHVWDDRASYFTGTLPDPPAGPSFPGEFTVSGSFTPSGLTIEGRITQVTIDDTGWVALPATPLTARNHIRVDNFLGANDMLIQYADKNGPAITYGKTIPQGSWDGWDITDDIEIYGRAVSGSFPVIVEEIA
jgi:hypothetical protein